MNKVNCLRGTGRHRFNSFVESSETFEAFQFSVIEPQGWADMIKTGEDPSMFTYQVVDSKLLATSKDSNRVLFYTPERMIWSVCK